ncbi:hypothetical protein NDU88_002009, partial [Pleurodeles waltl]
VRARVAPLNVLHIQWAQTAGHAGGWAFCWKAETFSCHSSGRRLERLKTWRDWK